ncbi:hypothetical protein NP493_163g02017 [Ridgeia piscesae]|uniref:Spliceosome-associated protein CWC27 homolog n=1 Tax=Ridgeia piscesae TaxID=27915 RepID=A0AAD9UFM4_RIDPI|nr:hypothetical protein NP493_163g02017 [Ridgeia piscesae]
MIILQVLLVTTVGDIDVELWSKEAPRACRNFVQLCMEGYYDGSIFHRVVKDFIVQGGDPTGTGHGGDSIYGKPFRDEFHSRLRFVRRGLVAMANSGPNDNGSQFFFTLTATPELINKHTIFGKIEGNTIYNMLKLAECETDSNERPLYPHKLVRAKILANPFEDIIPRTLPKKADRGGEERKKSKSKATKNFSLLSFGAEAEEDEEEVEEATKKIKHKSKSSHDLLNDKKLSRVPAVEVDESAVSPSKRIHSDDSESPDEKLDEEKELVKERIKKKLKKDSSGATGGGGEARGEEDNDRDNTRMEELKKEAEMLKRELRALKKSEKEKKDKVERDEDASPTDKASENPEDADDLISRHKAERQKYKQLKKKQPRKGSSREQETLAILAKFQSKLNASKMLNEYGDEDEEKEEEEKKLEEDVDEGAATDDFSWLSHKLQFEGRDANVIDANIDNEDRYTISDPRNPLTQRRREASKQAMKGKR